jgi:hypothetical protein
MKQQRPARCLGRKSCLLSILTSLAWNMGCFPLGQGAAGTRIPQLRGTPRDRVCQEYVEAYRGQQQFVHRDQQLRGDVTSMDS